VDESGWVVVEDFGCGWWRVVVFLMLVEIFEFDVICMLLEDGFMVVAGGGGGVLFA